MGCKLARIKIKGQAPQCSRSPSIIASPTTSTVPTAWNRREARSASAGLAKPPRQMAEAPWPMAAGVLGMTRMMRHVEAPGPAASMAVSCAMLMPAATEITSVEGLSAPRRLSSALAMTYGLTASTSTSTFFATSALSLVQCTPVSRTARRGPEGEDTHTQPAETVPCASSPRISAEAMLPAPMKPRRSSRSAMGEVLGGEQQGDLANWPICPFAPQKIGSFSTGSSICAFFESSKHLSAQVSAPLPILHVR